MSHSIFDVMLISTGGGKLSPVSKTNFRNPERMRKMSAYDRGLLEVEATGNKWAIENYKATHNRNDGT